MARIVVAMSGGVDSSVTAALLQREGHEVIGITLNVWPKELSALGEDERTRACCGVSAVEDARRVADLLGIPYYVLNFRDLFRDVVINDFIREYARGRTPNPCVRCNRGVKFRPLLARAVALGAEFMATGHYVRRDYDPGTGRYRLLKAVDPHKDQSYVLFPLTQFELSRTLFPLGEYPKSETRRLAEELGLPVAHKPESQEICFVPGNDYKQFLREQMPQVANPGPILDTRGCVLGMHQGVAFYTVGQRKGLALTTSQPMYVVAIDPELNVVVVGDRNELYAQDLIADDFNAVALPELMGPLRVMARIRYHMQEAPATLYPLPDGRLHVRFDEPQRAITPGQSAVFYDGDVVLGGATIASSGRPEQNPDRSEPAAAVARA